MLQTSAALGWILAVSAEWFMAFGVPFPPGNVFGWGGWIWVLLVHGVRLVRRGAGEGRPLLLASAMTLVVYLVGLRFEELWFHIPMEYVRSRRAEILSTELHGVPWPLFLTGVGLVPGTLLLSRWLALGSASWSASPSPRLRGSEHPWLKIDWFQLGWLRHCALPLALAYLGLTLLVVVRYGSGALAP